MAQRQSGPSGSRLSTVVVDASPILDRSGTRGIGRYVFDLLVGLEAIRGEWARDLRISAVTDLGWFGTGAISEDLGRVAEDLRARCGSQKVTILRKRRLSLSAVARGADLLHLAEPIGMPMTKLSRWVVTCYDLIPLRMPEEYLGGNKLRILERRAKDWVRYHRGDAVVTISERTREDVLGMLGLRPDQVVHVPTGIDLEHWRSTPKSNDAALRARLGVGSRPYVLFVGEGDQRKGIATMMRAVAHVRRELDLELVWAGKLPDKDMARFREMVRAERLTDFVRFTGFVPDAELSALYRGAVAHVFLSVLEGFGLPVAEALASECPVVVVRGSGCDEIAGDAAHVIAPNDAEAAARAILSLARDQDDRERRIRLGSARIDRYDRVAMARGYVDVWRRTLGSTRT